MSFGRPDFLWLLALALPVVVLYMLRRKRKRLSISSLVLWERVVAAAPRRFGAGVLTSLLSLLLMLLALGGGALSAADPILGSDAPPPRHLLLAVGSSARMQGERFDRAVLLAREEIARKAPYDPVTVLLVSDRPRILAAGETNPSTLHEALDRARPSLTPARWELADLAIVEVLGDSGRAVAIGVRPGVPPGTTVLAVPGENSGILDFAVAVEDERVRVFLKISGATDEAEVVLTLGGVEVSRAPAREEVLLIIPRGAGGLLRASLEPSAGPTFDDTVEAHIPAPPALTVGVSTTGAVDPFLRAALAVSGALAGDGEKFDVRVIAGQAAPEKLFPGDWILLTPPPVGLGFLPLPPVPVSPIWSASQSHPVMRGVDAAEVQVMGATPARPPADAEALLSVPGGVVAAAGELDGVRYVWIGLETGNSTLPVTGAFPLMIRNAIAWFASLRSDALPPATRVGDPVRPAVRLPRGTAAVIITGPGEGERAVVEVVNGTFDFTPEELVEGEVRVSVGQEEHRTRLNAIYPEETAARPLPAGALPLHAEDRSALRSTRQQVWPWFALAAAAFLLLEWLLPRGQV